MSTYHPFFIGETTLRADTEAVLCAEPGAVESQIAELDEMVRSAGKWATFGAEVEYSLIDGPDADPKSTLSPDDMYMEVVKAVQGDVPFPQYSKGQIVNPRSHKQPIMVTEYNLGTWNPDQPDTDICEIRTAPAGALEALDRYWTMIGAIGTVAAQYGQIALILGTHINAAVLDNFEQDNERFAQFMTPAGRVLLAAAQHNLNSTYGLQIHAGLSRGIVIQEAFPYSKDGSTAIFDKRMEIRHPDVAIADPRIDMLAVLSAAQDVATNHVPTTAMTNVRECARVEVYEPANLNLASGLELLTVWDPKEQRLVMPAHVNPTGHGGYSEALDSVISDATGGVHNDWFADNGEVLRSMLQSMPIRDMRLRPENDHPWAAGMNRVFGRAVVTTDEKVNRVLPIGIVDSPEMHAERRRNLPRSSRIRRIFGSATPKLSKAADAISRRQELLDNHMITLDD